MVDRVEGDWTWLFLVIHDGWPWVVMFDHGWSWLALFDHGCYCWTCLHCHGWLRFSKLPFLRGVQHVGSCCSWQYKSLGNIFLILGLLFPAVHSCWRPGYKSSHSWHCDHFWLRLEPPEWLASSGTCSQNRTEKSGWSAGWFCWDSTPNLLERVEKLSSTYPEWDGLLFVFR